MLIEVRDAVFGYGSRSVVHVNHLVLQPGRCLGIFGPNGAGKTTMVRGIAGLLQPTSGRVVRQPVLRIGYLPQQRSIDLHWPMTGFDVASLTLFATRRLGWIGSNIAGIERMLRALEVDDLASRPLASLSGGQQQRLLLAGALAADPKLIVLDESIEGLDVRSRDILIRALRSAIADGLSAILISHNVDDVIALSDELAWVHVADKTGSPNSVEVLSPSALAARVSSMSRTA